MTYAELLELVRQAEGRTFETVRGMRFRVRTYRDVPVFVPLSTGLGRSDGRMAAERFLERYNDTGSLRPGDYADVTRNASYLIALLRWASVG